MKSTVYDPIEAFVFKVLEHQTWPKQRTGTTCCNYMQRLFLAGFGCEAGRMSETLPRHLKLNAIKRPDCAPSSWLLKDLKAVFCHLPRCLVFGFGMLWQKKVVELVGTAGCSWADFMS